MQTNGSWFPSSTELGRPLTLGSVLVFVSIIRTYRRELDELRGHSVTMRTIASEQGLVGLGPSGTILEGWVLLQQKQVERGVASCAKG